MNTITDVLLYPYSKAQAHFEKAGEQSQWLGRTVHYGVGALECIPVVNYLVVVIDIIVSRIFMGAEKPVGGSTPSETKGGELPVNIRVFSEWLDGVLQMEDGVEEEFVGWVDNSIETLNHWNEEKGDRKWDMRNYPINQMKQEFAEKAAQFGFEAIGEDDIYDSAMKLKELLPQAKVKAVSQAKIALIKSEVGALKGKNRGYDFGAWDQALLSHDLGEVGIALKRLDEVRQMWLEGELRGVLGGLIEPKPYQTFQAYFDYIGITKLEDQVGASFWKFEGYGLTTLDDLQCLQLDRYRDQITTLRRLKACARFGFEQEFQAAWNRFVKGYQEVIDLARFRDREFKDVLTAENVREFDKRRQIADLKGYILQQNHPQGWQKLRGMEITTLAGYRKAFEEANLYEIGLNT